MEHNGKVLLLNVDERKSSPGFPKVFFFFQKCCSGCSLSIHGKCGKNSAQGMSPGFSYTEVPVFTERQELILYTSFLGDIRTSCAVCMLLIAIVH